MQSKLEMLGNVDVPLMAVCLQDARTDAQVI